jgi:rare lipoprotein A (peptidoglycan hydrolase)
MRSLFAAALAALALVGLGSPPAAAAVGGGVRGAGAADDAGPARLHLARAVIDDEEEARARRRSHVYEGWHPHWTKPADARTAKRARKRVGRHTRKHTRSHTRRHGRVVQRPARAAVRRQAARAVVGSGLVGVASYYGGRFHGRRTASGVRFNQNGMTAAHRTLPFGTRVRVTHLGNGRTVEVRINDRGPFVGGRIIDLSHGAAGVIGMHSQGVARVRVTVLGR